MNVAVTRGAEGFPRRAFSVDDIRRMIDIGLIGPEENFELIEGEIVPMQAKSVARKRGKTGGGMIFRFSGRHESDSFWEWCRLPTSMAYRTPI